MIAYFITPHGYGHAARSCAVMQAVHDLDSSARFEVFTLVPRHFFEQSLRLPFNYHPTLSDVGLAQQTPLRADLRETLRRLREFLPFKDEEVRRLAQLIRDANCRVVACDISPLGLAVARAAGLPSVLIENFTWDWIYEGYASEEPKLLSFAAWMKELFDAAGYRVRTTPFCGPAAKSNLVTAPVSRAPRLSTSAVRASLGLPLRARAVLVTMGGVPASFPFLDALERYRSACFVLPGGAPEVTRRGNLVLLPHHSEFYHPDMVNAVDALIGKVGYSTVAEAYHAAAPFLYVPRPGFRESEVLAEFVRRELKSASVSEEEFESGAWTARLDALFDDERLGRLIENGAFEVARFLLDLCRGN